MGASYFRYSLVPSSLTLILHIALIYLASVEWFFDSPAVRVTTPDFLRASIQAASRLTSDAPVRREPVLRESPIAEPRSLPRAEALKVPLPDAPREYKAKSPAAESVNVPDIPPAPDIAPPPTLERAVPTTSIDEAVLNELLKTEEEHRTAEEQQTAEQVGIYVEAITRRIEANWRRPPNARRDMQTLLQIHLLPTGDVQGVRVIRSSGFAGFDDSAIAAVHRVGFFPELNGMDRKLFEHRFRRLNLHFKPEDLSR